MDKIVLKGGIVVTMEEPFVEPSVASVVIEGERILSVVSSLAEVDSYIANNPTARVVDCSGKVIMPGLINTHCHVSMTLQRGLADDIELMEWLNEWVWPFEAKQSEDDIEAGARLGIAEMLLGGVTTFVDMYFAQWRVAQAVEQMGIRALLAECLFDSNEQSALAAVDSLSEIAAREPRVMVGLGPHAPYTCSGELLGRCAEHSRAKSLPITIHLLESVSERDTVQQIHGCDPMEHIRRAGVLKSDTILAHCIQLCDSDVEAIRSSGASVSHNPQSNMKISSGVAPIAKLVEAGVNVTIGTDGACSNNDLDMWEEMRSAAMLQRVETMNPLVLPAYQVLKMVTVNGAKAIGMQGELGVVKSGALADLIVVDMMRPHLQPLHNILSTLVYCVKASDVDMTIVNGHILVDRGELLSVDLMGLIEEVNQRAKQILKRR